MKNIIPPSCTIALFQIADPLSKNTDDKLRNSAITDLCKLHLYCENLHGGIRVIQYFKAITAAKQGQLLLEGGELKPRELYSAMDPTASKWKTLDDFRKHCKCCIRWYQLVRIFGISICYILDDKEKNYFRRMQFFDNSSFQNLHSTLMEHAITKVNDFNALSRLSESNKKLFYNVPIHSANLNHCLIIIGMTAGLV
jgi:hypothetical protein